MSSLIMNTSKRNFSLKILLRGLSLRFGGICPFCLLTNPTGDSTPLHAAGWTPVFALPRLAEKLRLKHLWLKDESRNPTASFKDRASAIVVTRARELKAEMVVTASTGNAGAALAGMSAAVGQKADHLCAQVCSAGEGGAAADLRRESHFGGWHV